MTESDNKPADDMAEYLQAYLDETDEELETLVQAMLRLEQDSRDRNALSEAFRMMHSLKGSSGMMGYNGITDLAHHLETQFDHFRTGVSTLDRATMDLMLECVDHFQTFATDLRNGEDTNQDASDLIARLGTIKQHAVADSKNTLEGVAKTESPSPLLSSAGYRIRVTFQPGLQLADLKAKLIIARLSNVGEIVGSEPPVDEIQSFDDLPQFVVVIATDRSQSEIAKIADVDGVESVRLEVPGSSAARPVSTFDPDVTQVFEPDVHRPEELPEQPSKDPVTDGQIMGDGVSASDSPDDSYDPEVLDEEADTVSESNPLSAQASASGNPRVAETVRVDVDRLDRLLNLTGELVVTSARFTQISSRISPALRSSRRANQMSDVIDRLRVGLQQVRQSDGSGQHEWCSVLDELDGDLEALRDQSGLWDEGRRQLTLINDAVDQLTRVSQNLQKGVLGTRMVPVGPLFGRFKRVIRDLAVERGKDVELIIHGEKTELDKRMIDELGDPLLHLIRNSVDHGLESPTDRELAGKSSTGRIVLEAFHSGNNVLIAIEDDGAGISISLVREKIVEKGIAERQRADAMSDQQVIDHIWHPGFSTAKRVTGISGRGVGMDIVRSRISELNGSIDVSTQAGKGTKFLVRLPLTLAIIRSLMVRFRNGFFSIPIDNVREIVSVPAEQVYSVHGNETIDVRGEFLPITSMNKVFRWASFDDKGNSGSAVDADGLGDINRTVLGPSSGDGSRQDVEIVILQSRGKILGLCVDELLGGADIVIKSLADNFVGIRGLSGAGVMGDGTVSLMIDTDVVMEMAETGPG